MVTPCAMQFEYDPERLIEEMEKRPALWNFMDMNYKSMSARVSLWNEIVGALLDPKVQLSSGETRELVVQLQKKWKSLKDAYIKYLANPNKFKKPYVYSRQLQFLNQRGSKYCDVKLAKESVLVRRRKKKSGKKLQKPPVTVKIEDGSSDEEDDNDKCNESEDYCEVPCFPNDDNESSKTAVKSEEFAYASVDTIMKNPETEDCDKMFLLSLLPHLKSIPEDQRLGAKMKLLEVLQKANNVYII